MITSDYMSADNAYYVNFGHLQGFSSMDFYLILPNIYDIIPIIYLVSMDVVPDYYSLLIILVSLHTGVKNDFGRKYGKTQIIYK